MIEIKGLTKEFISGGQKVTALNNVDLQIQGGEFVLIKGSSGCGKSTLLFTAGGLLKPSAGSVRIANQELYTMSGKELLRYRAQKTGFVFQSYYLLPYLNVFENIIAANHLGGNTIRVDDVHQIAQRLKIEHRLKHKPSELSVGEKQRVSLARAMIVNPDIILADEPTGNLDPENAAEVLCCLHEFKEAGGTVVMVTHGAEADGCATRQIKMNKGQIT